MSNDTRSESPGSGYIYIPNWGDFQHRDVVRSSRMPWIRDYVNQLDNDAYLDLPLAYRAGLQDIRRLVAANGQGRCSARADYLQRRCNWPAGWSQKILERLSEAGFIEVRAVKAPAPSAQGASVELEGSKEPKKEIESARASSPPQAATHARTQTPSMNGHLDAADIGRRRNTVRTHYQGVLLENGEADAREWLEENHPDLVDTIIGHAKGSA